MPEKSSEEMLNAIGDSLSDLASSDNDTNGEDEDGDEKIQCWASWVKLMNPAEGWAQSPIWYSTVWRDFGRSRWYLMNWLNLDGEARPAIPVKEIWSTSWLDWRFWESWSSKWMKTQRYLHWQHLECLEWLLIWILEYHKCDKGLFNQAIVIWG